MKNEEKKPLTGAFRTDGQPLSIKEYEGAGGYQGLKKALRMAPKDVLEEVKASNLRGRGGAGFPTGQKWSFVPMGENAPRPKYVIANADEMEPGAFKDRLLMEADPHKLIEGMVIAAHAVEAERSYIFLRWVYKKEAAGLEKAIAEAYRAGYLGKNILGSGLNLEMQLHVSAGRYICGEETALLNALEGKRAIPRSKPPYPQSVGFRGKPTVVNNVETLCNIPHILAKGAQWYKSLSKSPDGGTKIYSVSGRVKNPGWWELPMGTTVGELFHERAGGMREGYGLKGIIPGGASTEFLLGEHMDVKMDFDSVPRAGSRLGTGTMIVLDDRTCPVGLMHNLQKFFARESCGWCTPCREGLPWIERLLWGFEEGTAGYGDIDILEEQTKLLGPGRTYCALAPGAMEPLQSALKYFRDEFKKHVEHKGCTYK
jgi:NADH-quinone oxidoreductase subunit F